MARAGLTSIMAAMADQIRGVLVTANELNVQVEPRWILVPTPLAIDVLPADPARDADSAAFGDISGAYILIVRARINTPDFDSSWDILMDMMDDEHDLSLAQAVLDEPTLNGKATSVDLRDFTGLRGYEKLDGEGGHLGFQFTALVFPADS